VKQETLKGFVLEPKPELNGKKERIVGEWDVQSWTNPRIRYKVRRDGSKWSCECYFFTERIAKSDKPSRACKHISEVKENLGLIKEDVTGYKSAIQKALRRGDLPLLKLSFSKLQEVEPKWIGWRLPILAAEESWKYMGIAGRYAFGEESTRENIFKLLANIALHPKNKEAEGLNIHADKIIKHSEDPNVLIKDPERMIIFNGWMGVKQRLDLIETDPDTFWGWFQYGDNEFAGEIVRTARRRSKFGGMSGDKTLLFVAAYLACVTKVDPIELEEVPKEEEVVAATEIPSYCWDMHTSVGKIAYYQTKKAIGDEDMGEYIAMECWFNISSAMTDFLIEDSYWWNLCLDAWAKRRGKTRAQTEADWERWMPRIMERVEKMLKGKRNRNPDHPQTTNGAAPDALPVRKEEIDPF
jgi:hypothetical protein